jgi:hypothetical protein
MGKTYIHNTRLQLQQVVDLLLLLLGEGAGVDDKRAKQASVFPNYL